MARCPDQRPGEEFVFILWGVESLLPTFLALKAAVKRTPLWPAHADEESPTSLVRKVTSLTKLKPTGGVGRRESLAEPCQGLGP